MFSYNIVCVGCGGTGSFFIKELARFMSTYRNANVNIGLAIIDGDRIEEKNLERQCFIDEDINSFKALTMAEAIKESFGIEKVFAYPIYLDDKESLASIFSDIQKETAEKYKRMEPVNILIGAVDNHPARQVMEKFFKESRSLFYFDSANEFSHGEVVFGGKHNGRILGRSRAYYFPAVMKDRSKKASEMGCGVINKSSPQHIVTNMLAANLLLGKLTPLITDGKISLGISYFDAFEPFVNFFEYKKGKSDEVEKKRKRDNKKNQQKD